MITAAGPPQIPSALGYEVGSSPRLSGAFPGTALRRARVTYSDHAWTRLQERRITAGAVESVVMNALRTYCQEDGRRVYIGRVAERFLKVVAEDRPYAPHVVTLYWVAAVH